MLVRHMSDNRSREISLHSGIAMTTFLLLDQHLHQSAFAGSSLSNERHNLRISGAGIKDLGICQNGRKSHEITQHGVIAFVS